jgi:cobalt-zinc-cadmium efflux system membrane fusion protein
MNARRTAARRRTKEQRMAQTELPAAQARNDWLPLLDEELSRLPQKYRQTIVLCELEGRTRKEAARHLGVPEGTVATRLARGRSMLARRLTQRGVMLSSAVLTAVLAGKASPCAAAPVVAATIKAASVHAVGQAAAPGLVSAKVVALAQGALKAMLLTNLKIASAVLAALAILVAGAGLLVRHTWAGQPQTVPSEVTAGMGIRTAEALPRGGKPRVLRLVGTLNYDTDQLFMVRSRFPGEVAEIGAVKDGEKTRPLRSGDKVKKGQLLAVIWSKDVGEGKAVFMDALHRWYMSDEALKRLEKVYKEGAVPLAAVAQAQREVQADLSAVLAAERTLRLWKLSDEEIKALRRESDRVSKNQGKRDAENEAARWARIEILAQADGTVIEKNAIVGDLVDSKSAPLFRLANLDRLQVFVTPSDPDLGILKGLPPEKLRWVIHVDGSAPIEGKFEIGPSRDPPRPLLAGFVDNSAQKLLVGQFATVSIDLPGQDPGESARPAQELMVPASALVEQEGATFVLVQPDSRKPVFEARRVLVVRRGSDVVHLRARLTPEQEGQGLRIIRPGEQVVTTGALELKAALDELQNKYKR